jgi:protein TonB
LALITIPVVFMLCIMGACLQADEKQITSSEQTKLPKIIDHPQRPGYPAPDDFVVVGSMPEMIYSAQPQYPEEAEHGGIEGEVWIRALIDEDGSVVDAAVQTSSDTDVGFEESALTAAKQYRYRPARDKSGNPVAVWVSYKVAFVLSE